jgi:hypothetical protein
MKRFLVPALLLACAVGTAKAGAVGSVAFGDTGTATSPGNDLNAATSFTLSGLFTDTGGQGIFASMGSVSFGTVSFSLNAPTSFSIADNPSVFGSFTSTSITEAINTPGVVAIYILGNYTAGSIDPGTSGAASLTLTFDQNPAHTGTVSSSGTFAIPPAPPPTIPEPSTVVMGLTSVVGGCFFYVLRRRSKKAAL